MDFPNPSDIAALNRDICALTCDSVYIAIGCTRFSTTTGDTYRTKDEPRGIAVALADPKRRLALGSSNRQAENSVDSFETCDATGVSVVAVEHPKGSRYWYYLSVHGRL